jgi:hypothetical protein
MINIILKNKTLIKIYKHSVKIFKFLNKHLYLLSILSFLSKARNSVYYKVISYILKLIIVINLVVTSGVFYAALDVQTPLLAVYDFYDKILSPYIDLLINKINNVSNINLEDSYVKSFRNNKELISSDLTNSTVDNTEPGFLERNKNYIAIAGAVFLLYFIFIIPGSTVDVKDLENYNLINKSLIHVKLAIKNLWNSYFGSNGNGGGSSADGTATELKNVASSSGSRSEITLGLGEQSYTKTNESISNSFNSNNSECFASGSSASSSGSTTPIVDQGSKGSTFPFSDTNSSTNIPVNNSSNYISNSGTNNLRSYLESSKNTQILDN